MDISKHAVIPAVVHLSWSVDGHVSNGLVALWFFNSRSDMMI